MDPGVFEVLLLYMDPKIFEILFTYHAMSFGKMITTASEQSETNNLSDENKLYNLKQAFVSTCRFLMRESQIKQEGVEQKVAQIRLNSTPLLEEQMHNTVKAMLSLNYSERTKDILVEQLFALVCFYPSRQDAFTKLKNCLQSYVSSNPSTFEAMFREFASLSCSRESLLIWKKRYSDIIEWINTAKDQMPAVLY